MDRDDDRRTNGWACEGVRYMYTPRKADKGDAQRKVRGAPVSFRAGGQSRRRSLDLLARLQDPTQRTSLSSSITTYLFPDGIILYRPGRDVACSHSGTLGAALHASRASECLREVYAFPVCPPFECCWDEGGVAHVIRVRTVQSHAVGCRDIAGGADVIELCLWAIQR